MNFNYTGNLNYGWNVSNYIKACSLSIDSENIIKASFSCSKTPYINSFDSKFAEGLFKFDVFEIFIFDLESKRYLEFNFSPNSHFWSALFKDYREIDKEINQEVNLFQTSLDKDSFKIEVVVDLNKYNLSFNKYFVNLNSILYNNDEKHFHSLNPLMSENPDFHSLRKQL